MHDGQLSPNCWTQALEGAFLQSKICLCKSNVKEFLKHAKITEQGSNKEAYTGKVDGTSIVNVNSDGV